MHRGNIRQVAATAVAGAALLAGAAHAQGTQWNSFGSATAIYQGSASLDGGGDYSAWSTILRAGVQGELGGGMRAGVIFIYDYADYEFSRPAEFGGVAPWGAVKRYGMAAPLSIMRSDGWNLGLTPSVDWIHEAGADVGESLTWGGIATAIRFFPDGNRIGFGLAVFDRLNETRALPIFIVDWRLSDRWRLANPLPAGPTGPAGLVLDYQLDGGWNLGLGAAVRSTRFRLSSSGQVPGGIAEEVGFPVFLRATRSLGQEATLQLYAGVVTAGQLRVEDASGRELRRVDFGSAPLLGATFSARF